MKFLYFLPISLALIGFSCKKTTEQQIVVESSVDIKLVNNKGNNILNDPNFKKNDIKVYYIINNKKELFNNGNLDYPKGYTIIENQNQEKILRLFLNNSDLSSITLLELTPEDIDTLTCDFIKKNGSVWCSKIKYNDITKWEINNKDYPESRSFSIVK